MEESRLKAIFAKDIFAKRSGVVIDTAARGEARGHMEVTEEHLNAAGTCQGGAIFTLADTLAAVAANSLGAMAVTMQSSIQYVRPAGLGRVDAHAYPMAEHKRMPSFKVDVTDSEGRLVAVSTSIFYVKDAQIKP